MFKLNDNQTGYEVYDDDGIYEETVKATLENMYDLIDKGYTFQKSPPVSGDHDHCYGCATMRHPCSDETRIHIETDEEYYKRVALIEGESQ